MLALDNVNAGSAAPDAAVFAHHGLPGRALPHCCLTSQCHQICRRVRGRQSFWARTAHWAIQCGLARRRPLQENHQVMLPASVGRLGHVRNMRLVQRMCECCAQRLTVGGYSETRTCVHVDATVTSHVHCCLQLGVALQIVSGSALVVAAPHAHADCCST